MAERHDPIPEGAAGAADPRGPEQGRGRAGGGPARVPEHGAGSRPR